MLALNARGMSKNDGRLRSVKRCCDQVGYCLRSTELKPHICTAVIPVSSTAQCRAYELCSQRLYAAP
jgi:hypothetical protein